MVSFLHYLRSQGEMGILGFLLADVSTAIWSRFNSWVLIYLNNY